MASIACSTFRSRVFQAHIWPAVSSRSYAAAAPKQKANPTRVPPPSPRVKAAPSWTTSEKATQSIRDKSQKSALSKEKTAADKTSNSTPDELKQLEDLKRMSERLTTTDIWGSEMATLDVEIPYDLRPMFKNLIREPMFTKRKFSDLAFAINHNFTNWVKSCISMLAMARANAFPEIDFSHFKLYQPSTLLRLANIQSHSRNSFLAPLKEIALQTYQTVHMAMIRQKESMLKDLTSGEFQKSYLRTMRKRPADVVIHWNIVSDISDEALFPKSRRPLITPPVTVVSVRAVEVYFAKEDPKLGHRLVIQALVKFDVSQSVKLTDREGRTVGDESGEPHRVVQYLILEKVGWYDSPWRFKEQVYRS